MTERCEEERRMSDAKLVEVEQSFERQLREHEIRETERIKTYLDLLKTEAFPDGAEAHRLAHQAMIDAAKAEKEFWQGLKTEIAKKSIWGILHILTILVIAGLAAKLGLTALIAGAVAK